MSWFSSNLSIGNLDLAGAVNKLSESVKSIEKNFDTALGFEEKAESDSSEGTNCSFILLVWSHAFLGNHIKTSQSKNFFSRVLTIRYLHGYVGRSNMLTLE